MAQNEQKSPYEETEGSNKHYTDDDSEWKRIRQRAETIPNILKGGDVHDSFLARTSFDEKIFVKLYTILFNQSFCIIALLAIICYFNTFSFIIKRRSGVHGSFCIFCGAWTPFLTLIAYCILFICIFALMVKEYHETSTGSLYGVYTNGAIVYHEDSSNYVVSLENYGGQCINENRSEFCFSNGGYCPVSTDLEYFDVVFLCETPIKFMQNYMKDFSFKYVYNGVFNCVAIIIYLLLNATMIYLLHTIPSRYVEDIEPVNVDTVGKSSINQTRPSFKSINSWGISTRRRDKKM